MMKLFNFSKHEKIENNKPVDNISDHIPDEVIEKWIELYNKENMDESTRSRHPKNKYRETDMLKDILIKRYFPKVHPRYYMDWIKGYMKNEGSPTKYCNFNEFEDRWHIAIKDFMLIPLFGSSHINIIVPEHVKWIGGHRGHIGLYYMKDHTHTGGDVPFYLNV